MNHSHLYKWSDFTQCSTLTRPPPRPPESSLTTLRSLVVPETTCFAFDFPTVSSFCLHRHRVAETSSMKDQRTVGKTKASIQPSLKDEQLLRGTVTCLSGRQWVVTSIHVRHVRRTPCRCSRPPERIHQEGRPGQRKEGFIVEGFRK